MSKTVRFILILFILGFILAVALVGWDTDFQVYQKAVLDFRQGGWLQVYQPKALTPYKYHPFVVFLLYPFGFLSSKAALGLWTLLNAAALYDTLRRLKNHLQCPDWVLLAALLCVLHAFFWQVRFSNVTVFMLWLMTVAATTRAVWKEALCVALLILLKPIWLALLPVYFLNRNFKGLLETGGIIALCSLLVLIFDPKSGWLPYELWYDTLADTTNSLNYPKEDNQCFYAILYRYKSAIQGSVLFYWFVGIGLYFLAWLFSVVRQKRLGDKFYLIVSVVPFILFAGPLTWIHHQLLLVPAFAYLLAKKMYWPVVPAWLLLNGTTSLFLGTEGYHWIYQAGMPVAGFILLSWGLARVDPRTDSSPALTRLHHS